MSEVPVPSNRRALVVIALAIVLVAVVLLLASRGPTTSPAGPTGTPSGIPSAGGTSSASPGEGSSEGPSQTPVALNVGLGFIPSVQFAPFYLAEQAGYYDAAGLDVSFRHGTDYDVIALVGEGELDLGLADGTSVIPAVSQGIPIKYVATIYGRFPSVVFAKASSGIADAADLKGRKLGIPGRYGSSWIMLQALLGSADLTPDDLQIVEYPDFGQGAAVTQDAVEAATGFANNEPVQLQLTGVEVNVLRVDSIVPLPGNGLITGAETIDSKGDALTGFIAANLRAMEEIKENPEVGLDAAIKQVPDLAASRDTQAAILDATIEVWSGPAQEARGLGAIEPADWEKSVEFLSKLDLVPNPVTVDDLIHTGFLPGAH
jgi:putative riboflavin transport system substrate-binding protein